MLFFGEEEVESPEELEELAGDFNSFDGLAELVVEAGASDNVELLGSGLDFFSGLAELEGCVSELSSWDSLDVALRLRCENCPRGSKTYATLFFSSPVGSIPTSKILAKKMQAVRS